MISTQTLEISQQEYHHRLSSLQEELDRRNLSGAVLFDRDYILYYCGFAFIPTERPVAFILSQEGETALFVPRLEMEHAAVSATVDHIESYIEYPGETHPMEFLIGIIRSLDIQPPYGADQDGYPWIFGYRGPALSTLLNEAPVILRAFIEEQMAIKSPAELALIIESVKWGNYAHTLLQRYTKIGESETVVSLRASMEATLAMLDSIGPVYRSQSAFSPGVEAGYRGQIGRNAAIPHAMSNNIIFQSGDVLVSGAGAPVWGYNSELERTMILGQPSDRQKFFFDHMCSLQELAISAIEPGIECSEVDRIVRNYYEEKDLFPYWRHHSGHAIGLRYHESPFLDIGDHTIIRPGMVFTIEPGLYDPELGGFRHSDTVVVKDAGAEVLTYYPRDLDSLTIKP